MEILFENSHTRNKELAKEIYFYYYFQRQWLVVGYIFIALSFLVNLLIAIFDTAANYSILVLVPLFFLLQWYRYCRHVNIMVNRDQEAHGKEISIETVITNENIQCRDSAGGVSKLEYDKIKNVVQTKNLILLLSKANLMYIFRNDAFTKGNKEDFLLFLKGKGIKIK